MFRNNKIILLTLLGIVGFAGYHYVFKKESVSDSGALVAVDTPGGASGEDAFGQELLMTLSKLKSLTLDDALFKDPIFINLNDFSNPIVPQEVGRNNPFSPISGLSNPDNGGASGDKKVKN